VRHSRCDWRSSAEFSLPTCPLRSGDSPCGLNEASFGEQSPPSKSPPHSRRAGYGFGGRTYQLKSSSCSEVQFRPLRVIAIRNCKDPRRLQTLFHTRWVQPEAPMKALRLDD
jgi:hypothetical protein